MTISDWSDSVSNFNLFTGCFELFLLEGFFFGMFDFFETFSFGVSIKELSKTSVSILLEEI